MVGKLSSVFIPRTLALTVAAAATFSIGMALVSSASAESPSSPSAPPSPSTSQPATATPNTAGTPALKPGKPGKGVNSPAFDNVRKALDALTPEQLKRFQENFLRWSNLSPEEKKVLRDREEIRKKFVTQEIDTAIKDTGLQLDPERREQFVKRYGEERRKIEEQLRKETIEKRKPLVRDMVAKLKEEFAAPAQIATPGTPAGSNQ